MDTTEIGSVNDMSIAEARRAQVGEQATFDEFGGNGETTYVAVTRSPDDDGDLEDVVDHVFEELGPPWYLFNEFMNLRKSYMDGGLSKEAAHNKAWEESNYGERFSKYLWWDNSDTENWDVKENGHEPRAAILDIIDMIKDGENVVLVCYCTGDMKCHRKIVRSDIEEWKRILVSMENRETAEDDSKSLDDLAESLGISTGEPGEQMELTDL